MLTDYGAHQVHREGARSWAPVLVERRRRLRFLQAHLEEHQAHGPRDAPPCVRGRRDPSSAAWRDSEGIAIGGTAVGGKVLIVDDDAGWREILSELLEGAGYQVRACGGR